MYAIACLAILFLAYGLTIVLTSVGYHRALAHSSVKLHPWARRALVTLGPWVTGFDPKTWVVMHRMHHIHSDTPDDPHSPVNVGLFGIFRAQVEGYERTKRGLLENDDTYARHGKDLALSWPTRTGRWWAPFLLHAALGLVVALTMGWWLGIALVAGLLSHVVQGAIINYFGHAHGGRNFDTDDNSRNNHPAAWLVLGEGFQNNHHRWPSSARFSYRWNEVDFGYIVCRALEQVGVLRVVERTLMPRPGMTA